MLCFQQKMNSYINLRCLGRSWRPKIHVKFGVGTFSVDKFRLHIRIVFLGSSFWQRGSAIPLGTRKISKFDVLSKKRIRILNLKRSGVQGGQIMEVRVGYFFFSFCIRSIKFTFLYFMFLDETFWVKNSLFVYVIWIVPSSEIASWRDMGSSFGVPGVRRTVRNSKNK